MSLIKFIFAGLICCVIFPLFEYLIGYLLSKTRFNRAGVRMMAMSGYFVGSLPRRCQLNDCTDCGNWNCPQYDKDRFH